jgi:hypothetical protein
MRIRKRRFRLRNLARLTGSTVLFCSIQAGVVTDGSLGVSKVSNSLKGGARRSCDKVSQGSSRWEDGPFASRG